MSGMTPLDEGTGGSWASPSQKEDLENYDTINGLLISRLDRIPGDGEQRGGGLLGDRFCEQRVENKMI